ncbi:MAG: hypothetical protein HY288_20390 [Planctomycetia bacterium]|nr:hypothetical protein [Planctomycetia bacterium]
MPKLVGILDQIGNEPDFSPPTELRCTSELLDARDLMMRLEWAVRDAILNSHEVAFIAEKSSNPVASPNRNQRRDLMLREDRGNWTPIELFLAGIRGWEGDFRRSLADDKSNSQ